MLVNLFNRVLKLPLWLHIAVVIVSMLANNWIYLQLEAYYIASMHPVDHLTGQIAFNGEKIKTYYATMLSHGTFDFYKTSQYIDFAFILSFACVGVFLSTLIARFCRSSSCGRHIAMFACASILLAAVCDVIEDVLSLVMIANPTDFPNWLAIPYSTFASIKFLLLVLGGSTILIALVFCVIGRVKNRADIG